MNNARIGITEAGDASVDYSWVNKINDFAGAILITKNVTDEFIDKILKYKDKIILHATCTGMGGTVIEPNVPDYMHQLTQVSKLVSLGFPESHITVRIDPIIPTEKGLQTAQKVIDASPIKRFRFSMLDTYPHVRVRFKANNIQPPYGDSFQPLPEQVKMMREWLSNQEPGLIFESCAEPKLADLSNVQAIGCVSEKDTAILGINITDNDGHGYQRRDCLCMSCKTELLSNKHRCPHGCLYCYWKD